MAEISTFGYPCAMMTDFYQITMAYAYWRAQKTNAIAVFDLYFRKNPFGGEYTVFAGLHEILKFVKNFHFTKEDIDYLKQQLPAYTEDTFFDYLLNVTTKDVKVFAVPEGTVMFPGVPLLRIEGPVAIVQLLESPCLNLVNFASLVTTNAARFRKAAGPDKKLLEFGLRRAQGPDGAFSASRYCYVGGFDATSNVLAGQKLGVPVAGTHAHAFVSSFHEEEDVKKMKVVRNPNKADPCYMLAKMESNDDFLALAESYRIKLKDQALDYCKSGVDPKQQELVAFAAYAHAFPEKFLVLVDTYNVLNSGVVNFCAVALALVDLGYCPKGIRIDSGDLAYLSLQSRHYINQVSKAFKVECLSKITIVASNDINEETLNSLAQQKHEIDAFGVGTHLVTCQNQPALGCVFKLVDLDGQPRIKISEDVKKVTIPGRKIAYRIYGKSGSPLIDLMTKVDEEPPKVGQRVLCRHPFVESKRVYVVPQRVERLLELYWNGETISRELPTLKELKDNIKSNLEGIREDHLRALNPTPYKVSVSESLYRQIHEMWVANSTVPELV
eukprot:m.65960 g.65960  ORF g.65960 m.65960 type:complete len:555 (-) comp11773_c0_seq1:23-1687(-)